MEFAIERDALQHHGIRGMKWGVRRYQNEDGSYTKEGLKRYRQAEAKYQEVDQKYKEAKASGKDARAEKAERKAAKRDLNKKYDQLKLDKRADRGKELYQQGETIDAVTRNRYMVNAALIGASTAIGIGAKYAAAKTNISIPTLIGAAIAGNAAITAGEVLVARSANRKIRDLRAYYGHSRK